MSSTAPHLADTAPVPTLGRRPEKKSWQVIAVHQDGVVASLPTPSAVTLTLAVDASFELLTGVIVARGWYESEGEQLRLTRTQLWEPLGELPNGSVERRLVDALTEGFVVQETGERTTLIGTRSTLLCRAGAPSARSAGRQS